MKDDEFVGTWDVRDPMPRDQRQDPADEDESAGEHGPSRPDRMSVSGVGALMARHGARPKNKPGAAAKCLPPPPPPQLRPHHQKAEKAAAAAAAITKAWKAEAEQPEQRRSLGVLV